MISKETQLLSILIKLLLGKILKEEITNIEEMAGYLEEIVTRLDSKMIGKMTEVIEVSTPIKRTNF